MCRYALLLALLLITWSVTPCCRRAVAQPARPFSQVELAFPGHPAHPPWQKRQRVGVMIEDSATTDDALLRSHRHRPAVPGVSPTTNARPTGAAAPVPARTLRRLGVRRRALDLIDLSLWPEEPQSPQAIDPKRFARAMQTLCPITVPATEAERYANWVRHYAEHFAVDPFVLGALVFHQSRCYFALQSSFGIGLTLVNLGMFGPGLQNGEYHYWVYHHGAWHPRQIDVSRFPFTALALRRPEVNLYFAAAFLRVFTEQFDAIRNLFGSVSHRHPVSHLVWGDQVRGTGPEDLILEARRRLLLYYQPDPNRPFVVYRGVSLSCPLDGGPRKVSGVLGDPREEGRRQHKGVDFVSHFGEPVRAAADGVVRVAGVDLKHDAFLSLQPRYLSLVPKWRLGPRGRFVTVEHANGVRSIYAHLATYVVQPDQRVRRGELIGYVGRTGIRLSDEHLHFGLFDKEMVLDPLTVLAPFAFGPDQMRSERRPAPGRRQRRWRMTRRAAQAWDERGRAHSPI